MKRKKEIKIKTKQKKIQKSKRNKNPKKRETMPLNCFLYICTHEYLKRIKYLFLF